MKYKDWNEFFPELKWLKSEKLHRLVTDMYDEAMALGGYKTLDELEAAPFTLRMSYGGLNLRDHIRTVTILCRNAYDAIQEGFGGDRAPLDFNTLIAGALLHDIGKIYEYTYDGKAEKYVLSHSGKLLKHCFTGAGLAIKHGAPDEITHIIANHADEGIGKYRSPEAVILNKCDFMAFDIVKAYLGLVQDS
jgi:putative nucleotidyltransferase with HDIG domain